MSPTENSLLSVARSLKDIAKSLRVLAGRGSERGLDE